MDTFVPTFKLLAKLQSLQLLERSRNNITPTDSERRELVDILNHATDELALYEATITCQCALAAELEEERQNLQVHLELTRSLLAPIRKLPTEVLSEIFVHHGSGNMIQIGFASLTQHPKHEIDAFALTPVSCFWRKTAIATARLWTTIVLGSADPLRKHAPSLMRLVLRNSRNADLDVWVDLQEQADNADANLPFSLLCEHSARWATFGGTLNGHNKCHVSSLSSIRGSLTRLKDLSVGGDWDYDDTVTGPVEWQEIFTTCPRLTRINSVPSNCKLPYEQITHTTIDMIRGPSVAWLKQITRFPNLQNVKATIAWGRPRKEPTPFTASIRQLTFTVFGNGGVEHISPLIQHAVLPQLETLAFTAFFKRHFINVPVDDIRKLLQRSSCTITTLRIINIKASPMLAKLVSILPSLTDFVLHAVWPKPETEELVELDKEGQPDNISLCHIIRDMTVQPTSPLKNLLLPRLTSLELHCPGSEDLHDRLLLNMIQSRRNSSQENVATLKSFNFHRADRPFGSEFIQAMLDLKQSGLLMLVKDSDGDIELH